MDRKDANTISHPHTRIITVLRVAITVSWESYYTCMAVAIYKLE